MSELPAPILLSLFHKVMRRKTLLGVIFATDCIQIASFTRYRHKIHLNAYVRHDLVLAKNYQEQQQQLDQYLAQQLKLAHLKLKKQLGSLIGNNRIILAVSEQNIICQTLNMPITPDSAQFEVALFSHIQKTIPIALDNIAMDYQIDSITQQLTMMVCKRQYIERLIAISQQAQLHLVAVRPENHALQQGKTIIQHTILSNGRCNKLIYQLLHAQTQLNRGLCGLVAAKSFNLMAWREAVLQQKYHWYILIALIFILSAQIPIMWHYVLNYKQHTALVQNHQTTLHAIQNLDQQLKQQQRSQERVKLYQRRLGEINSWQSNNYWLQQLLNVLSEATSKDIRLRQVHLAQPISILRGETKEVAAVYEFAKQIQKSKLIQNTQLSEISTNADKIWHEFNMELHLQHLTL